MPDKNRPCPLVKESAVFLLLFAERSSQSLLFPAKKNPEKDITGAEPFPETPESRIPSVRRFGADLRGLFLKVLTGKVFSSVLIRICISDF